MRPTTGRRSGSTASGSSGTAGARALSSPTKRRVFTPTARSSRRCGTRRALRLRRAAERGALHRRRARDRLPRRIRPRPVVRGAQLRRAARARTSRRTEHPGVSGPHPGRSRCRAGVERRPTSRSSSRIQPVLVSSPEEADAPVVAASAHPMTRRSSPSPASSQATRDRYLTGLDLDKPLDRSIFGEHVSEAASSGSSESTTTTLPCARSSPRTHAWAAWTTAPASWGRPTSSPTASKNSARGAMTACCCGATCTLSPCIAYSMTSCRSCVGAASSARSTSTATSGESARVLDSGCRGPGG